MTTRRRRLLLAAATLLCGVAWRSAAGRFSRRHPRTAKPPAIAHARFPAPEKSRALGLSVGSPSAPIGAPTRRAAAALVRALYRKEQLTRELDLEQVRFGKNYWEAERRGCDLAGLPAAREAMLRELSAEATQVLADMFPGEAGEPVVLPAIFDADHAGPNVAFLSAEARARFEAAILADDSGRGADPERLREIAVRVLPPDAADTYRQWNDASAVALRAQLIGFNQTENEFVALLQAQRASAEDGDPRVVPIALETALDPARREELRQLRDPARHTALNDLQRLGLPLGDAAWLAAARARAVADIGEIWRSNLVTDGIKREQVALVEGIFSQAVAAKLGVRKATLDGLAPDS